MLQLRRRLLSYALTLILCTGISFAAQALQGTSLPPGAVVQVSKVKCGYVGGSWIPGALLKNGNFLPARDTIASVKVQLKNKKLKPAAKIKLKAKLKKLSAALKKSARSCKGLPAGGPTPVETPAVPLPGATEVAWNVSAVLLESDIGGEYLYFCPANPAGTIPTIYGHDIYTSDSAICVAAVHLGLFKRGTGGNVKIRIKGPQTFFYGSVRNGIESEFYGPFSGSYSFVNIGTDTEILTGSVPQITWTRSAYQLYTFVGQQFTLLCPGGVNQTDSIWGTDLYTYDSAICPAAVHAGRITRASGGVVTVLIQPGASSYTASTRHGVTSQSYGPWSGSFSFVP